MRSPDAIFGECGNATFCAVQARGEVDHYFNSGVFVARPDNVTFVKFKNAIRADEDVHRAHEYPDQDMLNDMYWDWKALPSRYNVQSIGNGGPWDPDSDVFIHQKYWMLPDAVRDRLRVPRCCPSRRGSTTSGSSLGIYGKGTDGGRSSVFFVKVGCIIYPLHVSKFGRITASDSGGY